MVCRGVGQPHSEAIAVLQMSTDVHADQGLGSFRITGIEIQVPVQVPPADSVRRPKKRTRLQEGGAADVDLAASEDQEQEP
jgi:hypothetical protein